MHILLGFFLFVSTQVWAQTFLEIAGRYSPVIFQGQGVNPRADVFTNVDFDGDFNSYNNWKNLVIKPDALVYYGVQETSDHFYISYGFFYPRDYSYVCVWKHCHENDFEGIRVTVNKTSEEVVLLETFAHGKAKLDFSPRLQGDHAGIMIEGQGHGIYSLNQKKPETKSKKYLPQDYQLLSIETLWDLRSQVGPEQLWKSTFRHEGKRFSVGDIPAAFGGRKWGHGLANPPWSYKGNGKDARKGDWFLDPVTSLCEAGECIDAPDTTYLYNPYVQ